MNPSKDHENYYPGTLCFLHQARCLDECIAFTCQALWIQHIEFFSPVPFNPTHPILLATAWPMKSSSASSTAPPAEGSERRPKAKAKGKSKSKAAAKKKVKNDDDD